MKRFFIVTIFYGIWLTEMVALAMPLKEWQLLSQKEKADALRTIKQVDIEDIERFFGGPTLPLNDNTQIESPANEPCLHVVGTFPLPGIAIHDEIVIYFDEPLVPIPSTDDDTPVPMMLSPNIDGHILIQGNCLRFNSPYLPPLIANDKVRTIKVYLHPQLQSISGKQLCKNNREISFYKKALEFSDLRILQSEPTVLQINANFSYPVDTSEVQKLLIVKDTDGNRLNTLVELPPPSEASTQDNLKLTLTSEKDIRFPLIFMIPPGLKWGDKNECVASTVIASFPMRKFISSDEIIYEASDPPRIHIVFSENVHKDSLQNAVHVSEEENRNATVSLLSVNGNSATFQLTFEDDKPIPETIKVKLSRFIRSVDGRTVLGQDTPLKLAGESTDSTEDEEEMEEDTDRDLVVYYHYWDTENIDGYELVIRFNGIVTAEDLRKHISFSPPVELSDIEQHPQGKSLYVRGNWRSEEQYVMTISAGLKTIDGKKELSTTIQESLDETPTIAGAKFESSQQFYYLRKEALAPRVKARNITKANIKVARVFPNNMPAFVRDYVFQRGDDYFEETDLLDSYAGELGTLEVTFPNITDKTFTQELDVTKLLPPDKRGVFVMSIDPVYGWERSQRILVYTDFGTLAHWTKSELVIFVHDLFTSDAIPHALVSIYSSKLQKLADAFTDQQGIAHVRGFDSFFGVPALAVIQKGEDYSFLDLREQVEVDTPFTLSMPYFDREGYDAFIFLDRNLYRPGETAHIRWVVRTEYDKAVTNVPLQLRIANPQGRWICEMPVVLSEKGTGNYDLKTQRVNPTGKYTVELRAPGSEQPKGMAFFNLEEFVPNRIKVLAHFDKEVIQTKETATLLVIAENLSGGTASGLKSEASVFLKPLRYESKKFPGFVFGNEDELEQQVISLGESITDGNGQSLFTFTFSPAKDATMPLEVVAGGKVFEVGGRAASHVTSVRAFPDTIMLGIAATPRPDRETLDVRVLALNADETPASLSAVKVALEQQIWNFHIRRLGGSNEPRWDRDFSTITTFDVSLHEGMGTLEIPYPTYGEYRLRVFSTETCMYSTLTFQRWWDKVNMDTVTRPELIRLSLNRENFFPGDDLILRIESPYDGTAYVVLQGERIFDTKIVPVQNGEAQLKMVVSGEWFPNVWLQTTVVRNSQNEMFAHYPYSSFSMINVPVHNPDMQIETVLVNLPAKIEPSSSFELMLETRDHSGNPVSAEITVAAVDEGIHSILGYENPDPYTYFCRPRRIDVCYTHYYDKVFYQSQTMPIGGDIMRRLGITSQVDENWIKPVALWSGIVHSDSSGRASIPFAVPEFNGQLRLTAVAVTDRATGVASAPLVVRRPYLLRTSMPRFALVGDQFECTATIENTTENSVTALIKWASTGSLMGEGNQTVPLDPKGVKSFRVPITADRLTGQGILEWSATIKSDSDVELATLSEKAPIPVRPPVSYRTEISFYAIDPGERQIIQNVLFREDTALQTKLEISPDPFLKLRPAIRFLLRFPYGCVEQTVSRALPLYFFKNYIETYPDVLPEIMDTTRARATAEAYLSGAIEKLLSMQITDGGIGYWPGSLESYPYGSIYALHFLTLIRRDYSFTIYESAFRNLQRYALEILQNDNVTASSNYFLRPYACYVLALDGMIEAIDYIRRFDGVVIPESARYLLAAAHALHTNKPDEALASLYNLPSVEDGPRESSGTLNSSVRADAIKLIALVQMNAPTDKQLPFIRTLSSYLSEPEKFTTQEAAFAMTALVMFMEKNKESARDINITIKDMDGEHTITANQAYQKSIDGISPYVEIANTGNSPAYAYIEMGGNPLVASTVPKQQGIAISKQYFTDTWHRVDNNTFTHGQQYIVEIVIEPEKEIENLLITDLLPAGFEVSNPRLEPNLLPQLQSNLQGEVISEPEFLEVRDDRIALALRKVPPERHIFRYLVRAITPGTFQLPAIHAEAMYTPEIQATSLPAKIVIH